jgi:hypothetical protein
MVFCAFVRASTTPRAVPSYSIVSARLFLEDVLLIRSIIFCAWMPGRKMDGMISAFLSDPLISIEHFPKLEMPGSIKEHL